VGTVPPADGRPDETGRGEGAGRNVNVALPLGTGDAGYAAAMRRVVLPVLDAFAPQLIIGAIGQDAAQFDPNGRQAITMAGFHTLGGLLREAADRHADGRLVLVQEGGYAPTYAAFCLHATLEGVLGREQAIADPLAFLPDDASRADAAIEASVAQLRGYWPGAFG
jgi:acetoin utilization deacetylase AcuC-like enzyme